MRPDQRFHSETDGAELTRVLLRLSDNVTTLIRDARYIGLLAIAVLVAIIIAHFI